MGLNKNIFIALVLHICIVVEVKLESKNQPSVETQLYVVGLIKESVKQVTDCNPENPLSEVTSNRFTDEKARQVVQNPRNSQQRTHLSKGHNSVSTSKGDVISGLGSLDVANTSLGLEISSKIFESQTLKGGIKSLNNKSFLDSKVSRYFINQISKSHVNSSHSKFMEAILKPITNLAENTDISTILQIKPQELHKSLPRYADNFRKMNNVNAQKITNLGNTNSSMEVKRLSPENKFTNSTTIYTNYLDSSKELKIDEMKLLLETPYDIKQLQSSTINLSPKELGLDVTKRTLRKVFKFGPEGFVNKTSPLHSSYYENTVWDDPISFSNRLKRQLINKNEAHNNSLELQKVVLIHKEMVTAQSGFQDSLSSKNSIQDLNRTPFSQNTSSNDFQNSFQLFETNHDYMSSTKSPIWEQNASILEKPSTQLRHNSRTTPKLPTEPSLLDTVVSSSTSARTARPPLTSSPTGDPWPVKLAAETHGDLILGGLMMIHEREDSVTCGPIMPQGGIQALETMLYTLDVINSMPDAPFTLGAHILDDCDKDTYGLEMAVDFIKGETRLISCKASGI